MSNKHRKYEIFVIKREECPVCNGTCVVGEDPLMECPNCNGLHGYIETEITLQEALHEIGNFTPVTTLPVTDNQIDDLVKRMNDIFFQRLGEDHQSVMRRAVRGWLAVLNQPPAPSSD